MSTAELEIVSSNGAVAIKEAFAPFFTQAEEWKVKVAAVTDAKVARESRLILKKIRVEAKHKHTELKEESLKRGRFIDGLYNAVEVAISPLENQLLEVETKAAREAAARKAALVSSREAQLNPFGVNASYYSLGDMPDEQFERLLSDTRTAHEARLAEAARAAAERAAKEKADEEARIAKAQADAAERERLRIEAARLKAEKDEAEAQMKIEREKAAAEAARIAEESMKDRERLKAEADAAAAKAKTEREAAAAKAKAEKDAADAIAKREREAREKLEAEKREREAAEKRRQDLEVAEAARAAAAPDREKLTALSSLVRTIEVPEMSTAAGKAAANDIKAAIERLAYFIGSTAGKLDAPRIGGAA